MPRDYFRQEDLTPLSNVAPGGRIHVIGVCGVAMAQLAVVLSEKGYVVSGSDKEFYEPMAGLLHRSRVRICRGYAAANVSSDVQLAVIGNAVSYGHEEILAVEQQRIPYSIFPRLLYELAIQGRHSVVVSGTHGKTTTTALGAVVLEKLSLKPSYFVGGLVNDLTRSLVCGTGAVSFVEGDEYDSAFFAKIPKFFFYHPRTLIITSVEYDHADIYPDLESIKRQFDQLARLLTAGSTVICSADDPALGDLVRSWRKSAAAGILTYGSDKDADFRILSTKREGGAQVVHVQSGPWGEFFFSLPLAGLHNACNALAALIACRIAGVDLQAGCREISSFRGVKRRQEVRYAGEIVLIEDFAHHPTAVRETLRAVRQWHPQARIWAIFEARSNTSRRRIFQQDYQDAFVCADRVVLCEVAAKGIDQGLDLLDAAELSRGIARGGVASICLPNARAIKDHVLSQIEKGDVVVIMSNGSFDGLAGDLAQALERKPR